MPAVLVLAFVGALFWLERRHPLRPQVDPSARRLARNLAMALTTAVVTGPLERSLAGRAARWVERGGVGLVQRLPAGWPRCVAAVVLLDYSLYLWHVLLHRMPVLWRCHVAHHCDADLDASTALRFHFAEFFLSIPWRLAQIVLIGTSPRALGLWRTLTAAEVVFHHANLRLPPGVEHRLGLVLVTPALHGIHHSVVEAEQRSNFSSGLTVWDRLHGTLKADVPQASITIGVPGCRPADLTIGKLLAVPFVGGTGADGTARDRE